MTMTLDERPSFHAARTDELGIGSCPACGAHNAIPLFPDTEIRVTHTSQAIHTFSPARLYG